MGYELYGKIREPKRHKNKNRVQKRENSDTENFFESFSGKECEICLTTGEKLAGVLKANAHNKYDVILETADARFLIRKDCVVFVKVLFNRKEVI